MEAQNKDKLAAGCGTLIMAIVIVIISSTGDCGDQTFGDEDEGGASLDIGFLAKGLSGILLASVDFPKGFTGLGAFA
jgi:hypothetical protein